MKGVKGGDSRTAEVTLSKDAPNEDLRGKKINLEFEVLDVKKLKLPELTEDFRQELGGFTSERKRRDAIRKNLQRQLEYQHRKSPELRFRRYSRRAPIGSCHPDCCSVRSARELERAVMEMRRSGFSEAEIRARENLLRQNSTTSPATALKEHSFWSESPRKRKSRRKKAITRRKSSSSRRRVASLPVACGPSWKNGA